MSQQPGKPQKRRSQKTRLDTLRITRDRLVRSYALHDHAGIVTSLTDLWEQSKALIEPDLYRVEKARGRRLLELIVQVISISNTILPEKERNPVNLTEVLEAAMKAATNPTNENNSG